MDFDYRLITQGSVTIVSFKGKMSKESKDKMVFCLDELLKSQVSTVVLFFRDVSVIEHSILRDLTQIQQELRKNNFKFFITGLNNGLRQLLDEKGIIRANEVKNSLEEVLLQAVG